MDFLKNKIVHKEDGFFTTLVISKKQIVSIAIIFFLIFSTNLQAQQNHLDDYLSLAAENNPQLKSLFHYYMAALEKLPQAKSLPDPTVMFNLFVSPVETRVGAQRVGLTINQAFPWFGQLKAQEEVAAYNAKALYELFKDEKNKIQYQVRVTYYDLYVLEVAITITQRNMNLLNTFNELARVKLESGKGSAVDLLRVEIEAAQLDNQLRYLLDNREPLRAEFRALLNVEISIPIVLPTVLQQEEISESKNSLIDAMLASNPILKKMDFDIHSLNSEIDVAQKLGKPAFNVGIAYTNVSQRSDINIPDNGKDALIFPQIGVKIPLYRKKYNAMVKEKNYLKSANTYEKEGKKNFLNTSMEKAWRNYKHAIREVDLNTKLSQLANQSLDILVAEYTSAGKGFEEILRMERQALTYQLELEKAKADQNTSAAFIKYLTGN